jgi:predicted GNAT family N-acyltransferase
MVPATHYSVHAVNWREHHNELRMVRDKVFIEEQQVPEDLEWDEYDDCSYHVLATNRNSKPIGCGRLKPDGQIGRMAVLPEYRKQGVATAILENILDHARKNGHTILYLHAQIKAIPFYRKHGFVICSDIFMEAGIPHRTMKVEFEKKQA